MIRILKNLKPYKWLVLSVFACVFIESMANLYLPTLMSDIVDKGVVVGNKPYIWKMGGLMLFISAIGALASIAASYFSSGAAMGFGRDLRRKVFVHVLDFSLQEFDQVGTASLITRTTNDITQLQQVVIMLFRMVASAPIMFIGGLIMALSKDAKLSLILVATMPILAGSVLLIMSKAIPLFRTVQKRLDRLNLVLRENLTGVRVIRAFNREKHEQARLQNANKDLTDV